MQCLDINLPGSLSNATGLPLAYDDALMVAGSMFLWEPAHPVTPYVGVPPTGAALSGATITTTMPNIAQLAARNLLADPVADVDARFVRNDGTNTATNLDMIVERSGKGGLHVITSQANMSTFRFAVLNLPTTLRDYLFANLAHTFYLSAWYRITRAALANTGPYVSVQNNSGTSQGFFSIGVGGPLGALSYSGNSVAPSRNTLGNTIEQLANGWDGGNPVASANILTTLFGFGLVDSAYGDHARNKAFSAVIYRIYMEDLTVSGRSFAAVKAADDALYAAAFAAGGRYNGDTFTAPATFA